MLVLARKEGEEILIGENIVIKIQDVGSDTVKLSIDAPREIPVLRGELVQAVKENQIAVVTKQTEQSVHNKMELLHTLITNKK